MKGIREGKGGDGGREGRKEREGKEGGLEEGGTVYAIEFVPTRTNFPAEACCRTLAIQPRLDL